MLRRVLLEHSVITKLHWKQPSVIIHVKGGTSPLLT